MKYIDYYSSLMLSMIECIEQMHGSKYLLIYFSVYKTKSLTNVKFSDRIERASLDDKNREVIISVAHSFTITVHEHYLYWTDWYLRKLFI